MYATNTIAAGAAHFDLRAGLWDGGTKTDLIDRNTARGWRRRMDVFVTGWMCRTREVLDAQEIEYKAYIYNNIIYRD